MLPMIVLQSRHPEGRRSQAIPGTAFRERCSGCHCRYSGAGTAFRTVQSPDKAPLSVRAIRSAICNGMDFSQEGSRKGGISQPLTRNCPATHGRGQLRYFRHGPVGGLYASSHRYFPGIPSASGAALVRSPCIAPI